MERGSLYKSVLIVDDDPASRTTLKAILSKAGCNVHEAVDGRQALAFLRGQPVGVVLLALTLPGMTGLQVLKRLRRDVALREIPLIVITADEGMDIVTRCIERGAIDYLSKPLDPVLVKMSVGAALNAGQPRVEEKSHECRPGGVQEPAIGTDPDAGGKEASPMGRFLRILFRLMRPYRKQVLLVGLFMMVSMSIAAALPLGFKFITDDALMARDFRALVLILALLAAAEIVVTISDIARDYFYSRFSAMMLNDLRIGMFRALQRLSIGFYQRRSIGEIISHFTTDLASVETAIITCLQSTVSQCVFILVSLGLLFALDWRLAMIALLGLLIGVRAENWVEPRAASAGHRLKEEQAGVAGALQENVHGQPVVKMLRLQTVSIDRFRHQMLKLFYAANRAGFLTYMTDRIPERTISLFSFITIAIGSFFVYEGSLSIGSLISFQILLVALVASVSVLTWGLPQLLQASVGMERIERLINEPSEITDSGDARHLPRPSREIVFDQVSFGYSPERRNLEDVSLRIPLHRNVLLVGPSGCGKSTVLNLLLRFYDPAEGSVSIDGQDLRTVTQDSLRGHLGVVLQENFLFNISVRENIRLGRRDASDAEVEAAAKAAEIHEVIQNMPNGYDTRVGERGGKLSGGQRQRLAIARALLADPPILLLDEATSALDPATADSINQSLARLGRGRTVISVTHRLEAAPAADFIFAFRDGRLVEQGRHEELLVQDGLYARLWKKQSGISLSSDGSTAGVDPAKLREIPLLENLDDATLAEMAGLFVTEHYPPDRLVFQQGDAGDRAYIIARGRVSISRTTPSGEELQVAILEDGDYFGEVALIENVPRTASVRTLQHCVFLTIAFEHVQKLGDANPALRKVVKQVSKARLEELKSL